ncbi:hypothetical protein [Thermosediminibacter oceani]|uniref:Uncharacterized protein n=1 Tax=Thermosediminibacter oceani (strain ATCC BAA-1034 / DSM 16646 / JW/IW-1228P) TaxID=555079 RepID=D9S033_THEOJ|nr:hypothetical protein [Thermosediminibacter oceani]ADL06961.1 conserved hypothetical protein [Thermosediminibacter oceani DSM 16646]
MKCGFCGYEFDEEERGARTCGGCPMSGRCGKVKCPRCGYEMVKPSGLFKWLKRRREKINGR